MIDDLEIRSLEALRAETTEGVPRLAGHAVVTGVRSSDLGGFVEVVSPQALRSALAAGPDLVALVNHNTDRVIGRQSAGTLTVAQDERGLAFTVALPSHEAHLAESVSRGDLRHASFAFSQAKDSWDES